MSMFRGLWIGLALLVVALASMAQVGEVKCQNMGMGGQKANCDRCWTCDKDGTRVRDVSRCTSKCSKENCQCVGNCGQTH